MPADNCALSANSIRTHQVRAALAVLRPTMRVATLITVMTLVLGANPYLEQKIANLGANVFRIVRTPFAARTLISSIVISVNVGLFYGYYPASRAAQLDPIVCLRYE
jgi:putative ABC transport system permease protein